jgi:hypothetical protein
VEKLEVVVGTAIVVLGVVTLARGTRAASGRGTRWLDDIASFGIVPVLGIGLALNLRPKAVLLVVAAGLAITGADLRFEQNLVLVVLYTAIATCTVVVPIVLTILFPQRMERRLVSAKRWIAAHSTSAGAVIMILVGGFVIAVGITG